MIGIWYYGTGKKKTSTSKVFIKKGKGVIYINNTKIFEYFSVNYINIIYKPLNLSCLYNLDIYSYTSGGGISSKAHSMMYGISKAIIDYDKKYKKIFKINKFLKNDSRFVERKKIGRIKSRKKKQYSKR
ncbi:30S ribosomal protein S9 [Candidatus Vidania fulgoroideorum]